MKDLTESDLYIISSYNDMSIQVKRLNLKAKMFRGFADVTRLSILEALRSGEKTVSDIAESLQQSQSNISNHLACLRDCGLVSSRRNGKNIYYSIASKKVKSLLENSDVVLEEVYEGIYKCVRYKE